MEEKYQEISRAILDCCNVQADYVLKDGLSISIATNDILGKPYVKELNIKLRYVDKEALKAYKDEKGTTEEG